MEKRVVIIGAGPTGLGAAYRLQELGYTNWSIYEANDYVGGLSASFVDKMGFTWDIGGHIIFSHYEYFNNLFDKLMNKKYLEHMRESWIKIGDRLVPYPFQNNIKYLSRENILDCLYGLIEVRKTIQNPKNFKDWLYYTFGAGMTEIFFKPDNQKRWCYPLEKMGFNWIKERVNVIDIKKILRNVILEIDDVGWGPNNKFKFPLRGGTGGFFNEFIPFIKENLYFDDRLIGLDLKNKKIFFNSNKIDNYDFLVSTIPIDILIKSTEFKQLYKKIQLLKHNSAYIVGIGINQICPSKRSWIYFPEKNVPFYRITYLSNYSPYNTPDGKYYSLMCEICCPDIVRVNKDKIVEEIVRGLIKAQILNEDDKKDIVSEYLIEARYAYPIPTLDKDRILKEVQSFLEKNYVFSRGRFGSWKYEIGNMDHSIMQGVEIIDRLILGKQEQVWQN